MRLGRIRERVDDQLHSLITLACSKDEGGHSAEDLAAELREVVRETHLGVLVGFDGPHPGTNLLISSRRVPAISPPRWARYKSSIYSASWLATVRFSP